MWYTVCMSDWQAIQKLIGKELLIMHRLLNVMRMGKDIRVIAQKHEYSEE